MLNNKRMGLYIRKIKIRNDRQYNGQKKKDKNTTYDLH